MTARDDVIEQVAQPHTGPERRHGMSEAQTRMVRAGDLTADAIGKGLWAPARTVPDGDDSGWHWEADWRRISMISHTTKGVKIRCAKSAHLDHDFKASDYVTITREEFTR